MIEIQNIKTDNVDDVVNLLLDEGQQLFQIYFPKNTTLFSSANEDIADDYARLAYVGHKLSQLADNMDYKVIHPNEYNSVLFEVTAKDFGSLAALLLELSHLYENDNEHDDVTYNYWENIYQYVDDVKKSNCIPACPEFVEVYQEYISIKEDL